MPCSYSFLWILFSCLVSVHALDCPRGWFGLDCMYKCHCPGIDCGPADGQCMNASRCQAGWFGPGCQYADLAQVETVTGRGFRPLSVVTDGNENTCLGASTKEISVKWAIPYQITWLRISFHDSYAQSRFSVQFKTDWNKPIQCKNMRIYKVNNRAVDVYCDLNVLVTQVVLTWDGPSYLCSLYLSGGRNVALKQNSTQSSTDLGSFKTSVSGHAVDGDTNSDYIYGNCAQTGSGDPSPRWTVTFSRNFTVNRYLFYHKIDARYFLRRTYWFTLQGQTMDGQVVFLDRGAGSTRQNVYRVTTATSTSPIAQVSILSAGNVRRFTAAPSVLSLCEVEVYGDSICEPGWYGRDCELRCNCLDKTEACFISTGGCTSGCAPGYMGEGCSQMCPPGTYGQDCAWTCSQLCLADSDSVSQCHHINGTCLLGCQVGFNSPWCNTTCTTGTYGQGCDYECSKLCASDGSSDTPSCHHLHGVCLHGCRPGYQGQMCNQPCRPGQFGNECSLTCSQFCLEDNKNVSICDHSNGKCLLGCRPGYDGPFCNQTCTQGTFGLLCKSQCPEFCNSHSANTPTCPEFCNSHSDNTSTCPEFCNSHSDNTSTCHHIHGTCVQGCQSGYTGQMCDSLCKSGRYGPDCTNVCPELCSQDGAGIQECHHVNGVCLRGCMVGFEGPWCNKTCESGTHGHACSSPCPEFCEVIDIDAPVCHHINGTCLQGCQAGYSGATCIKPCDLGTFGRGCSFQCPQFCDVSITSDNVCHHVHGTCLQGCQAGYMGSTCNQPCKDGTFGPNCSHSCSQFCDGDSRSCDPFDGTCLLGCRSGIIGPLCNETTRTDEVSSDIIYTAWVVVIVPAAVILAAVGAVVWWRRRQIRTGLLNVAIHVRVSKSSSTEHIIKTELPDPDNHVVSD